MQTLVLLLLLCALLIPSISHHPSRPAFVPRGGSYDAARKEKESLKLDQIKALISKHAQSPPKLLSSATPRVPAITRSPDFLLRIQSATPFDAHLASFILKGIAEAERTNSTTPHSSSLAAQQPFLPESLRRSCMDPAVPLLAPSATLSDRKYEQLVECILCVLSPYLSRDPVLPPPAPDLATDDTKDSKDTKDHHQFDLQSCIKTAWGLASLNAHGTTSQKFGGISLRRIYSALSRLSISLLLSSPPPAPSLVVDVAWTFSYILSVSGTRSDKLMEACCDSLRNQTSSLAPWDCANLLWSLATHNNATAAAIDTTDAVKKRVAKLLRDDLDSRPPTASPDSPDAAVAASLEVLPDGATIVADAAAVIQTAEAAEQEAKLKAEIEVQRKEQENDVIDKLESLEEDIPVTLTVPAPTPSKAKRVRLTTSSASALSTFAPHELCTILNSLDVLRRPSANLLDMAVSKLASPQSSSPFDSMLPCDLSNLGVALAKMDPGRLQRKLDSPDYQEVLYQIARWALARLGVAPDDVPLASRSTLDGPDSFTPTNLSRLLWAIAFCDMRNHFVDPRAASVINDQKRRTLSELAEAAVEVAGSRLSSFSASELARIVWAYGKIGSIENSLHISFTYTVIGRIFASIESTLVEWERGGAEGSPPIDAGLLVKSSWAFVTIMVTVEGPSRNGDVLVVESLVQRVAKLCLRDDGAILRTLTGRDVLRLIWSCARVVQVKKKNGAIRNDAFRPLGELVRGRLLEISESTDWYPAETAIAIWSLAEVGGGVNENVTLTAEELERLNPTQTGMLLRALSGTGGQFMEMVAESLVRGIKIEGLSKAGDFVRVAQSLSGMSEQLQSEAAGTLASRIVEKIDLLSAPDIRTIVDSFAQLSDGAGAAPQLMESMQSEVRARLSCLAAANNEVGQGGDGVVDMILGARDALGGEGRGEGRGEEGATPAIVEAAARLERVVKGVNIDLDKYFEKQEDIASFELGRCKSALEAVARKGGEGERGG